MGRLRRLSLPCLCLFLLLFAALTHAIPALPNNDNDVAAAAAAGSSELATPTQTQHESSTPPHSSTSGSPTRKASATADSPHTSSARPSEQITAVHASRVSSDPDGRGPGPGPAPSATHRHHPPPRPPPDAEPRRARRPSLAALIFAVVGALAGVLLLLSVIRCLYIYRRTPARDRITAILHRHQLQREMAELERNPPRRESVVVVPPPPYLRPPEYDDESTPLSRQPNG